VHIKKTIAYTVALIGIANAHAPWNQGDARRFDPDKIHLAPTQHDNPETREVMTRYLAEVDEQNDPGAAMDDPAVLKAHREAARQTK